MFSEFLKMKTPKVETVEKLWKGSIDMHIHPAPDTGTQRRVDAMEAAITAQEAGMRAIVLKSHLYPTAVLAAAASHVAPDVKVFGSLCLDYDMGALNTRVVECQAKLGAKVLWMPTSDSIPNYKARNLEGGIAILDTDGKILPVVTEILQIVKDYSMILCSGHLSFDETIPLFEEAKRLGITRVVATHPLSTIRPPMSIDECRQLVSMGAYIEHCFRNTMPLLGAYDPRNYVEAIKAIGAEYTIMSTDMAQVTDPPPAEAMRMYIGTMLQIGVSEAEVELMVKTNPAKLLDLD